MRCTVMLVLLISLRSWINYYLTIPFTSTGENPRSSVGNLRIVEEEVIAVGHILRTISSHSTHPLVLEVATARGRQARATIRPSGFPFILYSLYFCSLFTLTFLPSSSISWPYFNLAVPKQSWMGSLFLLPSWMELALFDLLGPTFFWLEVLVI